MLLQCKKCNMKSVKILSYSDLRKVGKDIHFTSTYGIIDPLIVVGIAKAVCKVIGKITDYFITKEKKDEFVSVCELCGYYERLNQ